VARKLEGTKKNREKKATWRGYGLYREKVQAVKKKKARKQG